MTRDFSNPSYTRHAAYLKSVLNCEPTDELSTGVVRAMEKPLPPRISGIYVIVNMKTMDYYVGSSIDTHRRKMGHLYSMKTGNKGGSQLLRKHAVKYGIEVFKFLFIHNVEEDGLGEAEAFWIKELCPFYNLTISTTNRVRTTERTKQRILQRTKNAITGHRSSHVPVIQYDKEGNFIKEWRSISEINNALNITIGCITTACKKQTKSKGFLWRYKRDVES